MKKSFIEDPFIAPLFYIFFCVQINAMDSKLFFVPETKPLLDEQQTADTPAVKAPIVQSDTSQEQIVEASAKQPINPAAKMGKEGKKRKKATAPTRSKKKRPKKEKTARVTLHDLLAKEYLDVDQEIFCGDEVGHITDEGKIAYENEKAFKSPTGWVTRLNRANGKSGSTRPPNAWKIVTTIDKKTGQKVSLDYYRKAL